MFARKDLATIYNQVRVQRINTELNYRSETKKCGNSLLNISLSNAFTKLHSIREGGLDLIFDLIISDYNAGDLITESRQLWHFRFSFHPPHNYNLRHRCCCWPAVINIMITCYTFPSSHQRYISYLWRSCDNSSPKKKHVSTVGRIAEYAYYTSSLE